MHCAKSQIRASSIAQGTYVSREKPPPFRSCKSLSLSKISKAMPLPRNIWARKAPAGPAPMMSTLGSVLAIMVSDYNVVSLSIAGQLLGFVIRCSFLLESAILPLCQCPLYLFRFIVVQLSMTSMILALHQSIYRDTAKSPCMRLDNPVGDRG